MKTTKYYVYGTVSKVYYGVTTDEQRATQLLQNAKKYHPQEYWEIITERGDEQ